MNDYQRGIVIHTLAEFHRLNYGYTMFLCTSLHETARRLGPRYVQEAEALVNAIHTQLNEYEVLETWIDSTGFKRIRFDRHGMHATRIAWMNYMLENW